MISETSKLRFRGVNVNQIEMKLIKKLSSTNVRGWLRADKINMGGQNNFLARVLENLAA